MSKLRELLERAYEGKDIQEKVYGRFPFEISSECGAEEVIEIIQSLDRFQKEKEKVEDWDGDSQDDYWRLQKDYSKLLSTLTTEYPQEVVSGLKSECAETRFWVACALSESPTPKAVSAIKEYLASEMPKHHRSTAEKALKTCNARVGILSRIFGKNASAVTRTPAL